MAKLKAKTKKSKTRVDENGKFDPETAAWSWIENLSDPLNRKEIVDEHVRTAYRLYFPTHRCDDSASISCKKNCKQNPNCYAQLGIEKWLNPSEKIASEDNGSTVDSDDDDGTEFEKRPTFKGRNDQLTHVPVGLKNLGNTCYVNSFLQIWFHNVKFRKAIYSWKSQYISRSSTPELNNVDNNLNSSSDYKISNIIGSLQNLFAMMEFSPRRAVDPHDFITKLGLDPQVQQDAQEFSKLFLSLLEGDVMESQKDEADNVSTTTLPLMVKEQFRGNYEYVTKCCACNWESKTPASFYELDLTLQGQKTLSDCMNEFLHVEKLEGDNQYYCGGCQSKQDANRYMQLISLPKVLNLQLNRFIYDMQTGRKKKLNSFVQFPEELDMSLYTPKGAKKVNYDRQANNPYVLTGVLMHVGTDANHGHYVAHIKDIVTGHWFKFSDTVVETLVGDEEVSKMTHSTDERETSNSPVPKKGKKLGITPSTKPSHLNDSQIPNIKTNKLPKKLLRSNSAYMLVYTEKCWFNSMTEIENKSQNLRQMVKLHSEQKDREGQKKINENVRVTKLRGNRSVTILSNPLRRTLSKLNGQESSESNSSITSKQDNEIPETNNSLSRENEAINGQETDSNNKYTNDVHPINADEGKSEANLLSSKNKKSGKATHEGKIKRKFAENNSCGNCEGCKLPKCGQCILCLDPPHTGPENTNSSVCLLNQCHNPIRTNRNLSNSYTIEKSDTSVQILPSIHTKVKSKKLFQKDENKSSFISENNLVTKTDSLSNFSDDFMYINGTVYPIDFPKHLIDYVENDKKLFEEQLTEKRKNQKEDKSKTAIYEERMKEICENVVYDKSEDKNLNFEFVPKKSLCQFLESNSTNRTPLILDNSLYLCAHGNIDVDQLSELKLVTQHSADQMFQPERLKLNGNLLCRNCIINRCRMKKLALRLAIDGKEITELLKVPNPEVLKPERTGLVVKENQITNGKNPCSVKSYWVGKHSLRKWRNMAKDNLHREVAAEVGLILGPSTMDTKSTSSRTNGQLNSTNSDSASEVLNVSADSVHDSGENLNGIEYERFNKDISCKHGNLCPEFSSKGRLVPSSVWNKFIYYFGDENCPTFTVNSDVCTLCQDTARSEAVIHEEKKELALHQKSQLSDIFNERNRPTWSKSSINVVYLISRNFVETWRYFVRNPANRCPVKTVGNLSLLCEHELLAFPLRLDTESDYESTVYMVYEEEWVTLKHLFEIDKEICVTRNRGNNVAHSSHITPDAVNIIKQELFSSEPKVCKECVDKKSREELEEKLNYNNMPIYVRKLSAADKCDDPDFSGFDSWEQPTDASSTIDSVEDVENSSKNEDHSCPPNKKKKTDEDINQLTPGASTTSPSAILTPKTIQLNGANDQLRRSNRRQKARGEKEYLVDSTMLLRDLKVKIMETYKVAPFDQNLWVHGKYLTDPTKTLGELRIFPKSLIYLRADEPSLTGSNSKSNLDEDTSWVVPQHDPQEGFKGTGLMSSVI